MQSSLHNLLLLSDSALPLGSFAFSSGLESFLAHTKQRQSSQKTTNLSALFDTFLTQSIQNVGSTALPYVLEAYRDPSRLQNLDNDFDAATPCTVARRASTTQGRALLTVWERALLPSSSDTDSSSPRQGASKALPHLKSFTQAMKSGKSPPTPCSLQTYTTTPQGHFAPLFGAISLTLDLSPSDAAYVFMLNHAKALLSAAVRASAIGPYQAQMILASPHLQTTLDEVIRSETGKRSHQASVTVPTMDLWMGRHELLYSRIFNS